MAEDALRGGFTNGVFLVGEVFPKPVSYTHLRAHETVLDLVCRLLLEKKKEKYQRRSQFPGQLQTQRHEGQSSKHA